MKDILTVKDLAEEWGVCEQTIYNKVRRKEIPFFKVGRAVRFNRSAIEDYMGITKEITPLKAV